MRIQPRISRGIALLLALAPPAATAQDIDILDGAPPTRLYVETAYDANPGNAACDWYATGDEVLESLRGAGGELATDCVIDLRMRGTLNRAGAALFLALAEELAKSRLVPSAIVLDSRGGDADAALAIARAIRGMDVFRRVPGGVATRLDTTASAVCFSACIVVFAAGYRRSVEFNIFDDPALPSRLGIHSPGQYDRAASRYDTSHQNLEIARIRQALSDYFAGVGVDVALVDDMFAVPFNEIRLLNEAAVRRYGLLGAQD